MIPTADSCYGDDKIAPPQDKTLQTVTLDDAQEIVRNFSNLTDGWDGPGTVAPDREIIEDALTVLQHWSMSDPIPEPEAGPDGTIGLEFYDEHGFTRGGIELIGDHCALFTIIDCATIITKGRFHTKNSSEMSKHLELFKLR